MGSREQMCINPEVSRLESNAEMVSNPTEPPPTTERPCRPMPAVARCRPGAAPTTTMCRVGSIFAFSWASWGGGGAYPVL